VALLVGVVMVHLIHPGVGFGADVHHLDTHAMAAYAGKAAQHEGLVGFLTNIVPDSFIGAFANGEILQVVLISVLSGAVLAQIGEKGAPFRALIDRAPRWSSASPIRSCGWLPLARAGRWPSLWAVSGSARWASWPGWWGRSMPPGWCSSLSGWAR
jgi:hypothetical protein